MPPNLDTLPPEIQAQIVRHLVDPNDLVGTLKSMNGLRSLNKSLNTFVEDSLNSGAIGEINSTLLENNPTLDELPTGEHTTSNRVLSNLRYLTVEADFIPLTSISKRSAIVDGVLRQKTYASEGAILNLISNTEYLKPEEKSRIVDHVCSFQRSFGEAEYLVNELVIKAEYLTPADRSTLVSQGHAFSAELRRKSLEFWSDRMHLLGEEDQSRVLSHIYENGDEKGHSLAYFAEHVDKLSPANRSTLTDHVIELPAHHQGKWHALSHLSEHLPALSERHRERVASHIVERYASNVQETVELDQPWYSKADFCKIEALHHLSAHWEPHEVGALIKETINRPGAERFAAQAQLLTHLPDELRHGFVSSALKQGGEQQSEVIYALTARMKDLDDRERQIYLSRVIGARPIYNDISKEAVDYNICNNLEHFTADQRTTLVRHQLDIVTDHEDPSYAGSAFADLARNARHLRAQDIDSIVDAANSVVSKYVDDLDEMNVEVGASIRSCSGHAVRCLASWAGEAISNPRAAQWVSSVEETGVTDHDVTDDTDGEPDDESRRASRRFDEWLSEEGSLYSDGYGTGSSDDNYGRGTSAGRGHRRLHSRSASTSVDDGSDAGTEAPQRLHNRLGRSAREAIPISSDDEESAAISLTGPSNPAGWIEKRRRDEPAVDQSYDTGSIEEPMPKRQQLENRARSRSSTIEL